MHVVLDKQQGDLELLANAAQEASELGGFGGVHSRGGFVEEQETGAEGEGAGDFEFALEAVGEIGGVAVGVVGEAQGIKQFETGRYGAGFVAAETRESQHGFARLVAELGIEGDADIGQDGLGAEEADILKCPPDAREGDLSRAHAVEDVPGKADGAAGGLIDAGDEIEEGCFSGSIWTDDAMSLTRMDSEAAIVDGAQSSKLLGDMLDL